MNEEDETDIYRFTLRLPKTLRNKLMAAADEEYVSINSYLLKLIRRDVDKKNAKRKRRTA